MKRLAVLTLTLVVFALAGTSFYYWYDVRLSRVQTATLVAEAFARHGRKLELAALSPRRKDMLLAIEDPAFFRHRGVDLETPGAGMTTLTQGLVKLIYFPDGFQQGIGKVRQTLIAHHVLDDMLSKDEQLTLFLNISYFGNVNGKPVYGLEDASQAYFGKPFTEISDDAFLSLVAMLIAPNDLKPGTPMGIARLQRVNAFLKGELKPASVLDVDYTGKTRGTFAEEVLMGILRIITDASP